jgi:hypothetical protein
VEENNKKGPDCVSNTPPPSNADPLVRNFFRNPSTDGEKLPLVDGETYFLRTAVMNMQIETEAKVISLALVMNWPFLLPLFLTCVVLNLSPFLCAPDKLC